MCVCVCVCVYKNAGWDEVVGIRDQPRITVTASRQSIASNSEKKLTIAILVLLEQACERAEQAFDGGCNCERVIDKLGAIMSE